MANKIDEAVTIELIRLATDAKAKAYNQHSNFRVGASVLTDKGRIFCGMKINYI